MPHDIQHFELNGGFWKELWFPGAQGPGRFSNFDWSPGGFHVEEVINLLASGAGSLVDAVTGTWSGSRLVVFRTGGTVALTSATKNISDGPLCVAGQTAPGGGFQIRGDSSAGFLIRVRAPDNCWRYLRMRGEDAGGALFRIDMVTIADAPMDDSIGDHLSLYWNDDDNAITKDESTYEYNMQGITIQRSILAESLAAHSTAFFIAGSDQNEAFKSLKAIGFHHNLIANSSHRSPLLRTAPDGPGVLIINNIIYNWMGSRAADIEFETRCDIRSNYAKDGPGTTSVVVWRSREWDGYAHSIYADGNARNSFTPAADQWGPTLWEVRQQGTPPPNSGDPVPASEKRSPYVPDDPQGITIQSLQDMYNSLVAVDRDVGAVWQLDDVGGWQSAEDPTDTQTLDDVRDNTGPSSLVVSPATSPSGGHPTLAAGTPPVITHVDCHIPDTVVESVGWWLNKNLNNDEKLDRWGIPCMKHYICGTKPNWRGSSVRAGV